MTLIARFRKTGLLTSRHAWLAKLLAASFLFFLIMGLLWLVFFAVVLLRVF